MSLMPVWMWRRPAHTNALALPAGAQSEMAETIFQAMRAHRCKPDAATYAALISAHGGACCWRSAMQVSLSLFCMSGHGLNFEAYKGCMQAYEGMQMSGARADVGVFNAIINALWQSGCLAAQAKAVQIHRATLRGHNGGTGLAIITGASADGSLEATAPSSSQGVAVLMLHKWLRDLQTLVAGSGVAALGACPTLNLGTAVSVECLRSAVALHSNSCFLFCRPGTEGQSGVGRHAGCNCDCAAGLWLALQVR